MLKKFWNAELMNLEDVAKEAGVSRSTVSRVLNNERYVSAKTRTRVMEIVERLNFSPNHAARTLVTQRSQIIGVVIPNFTKIFFGDNSYFPMLLEGVTETANTLEYSILLSVSQRDEDREHFSQRIIRNRITDGFVIASITHDDPLFEQLIANIPRFVMVERPLRYADKISYVTSDNVHGGFIATEHFIKLGRRRVAHITGHLNISDGLDRLEGYKQALQAADIPYDPALVYNGAFSYQSGYEGAQALLPHKPDAIFTASDTIALGAIRAINEAGLRVPEDVGVIGFDDLVEVAKSNPPLTTVRQLVQEKGAIAASMLVDMINDKFTEPQRVSLPTELVIRQSCGAN